MNKDYINGLKRALELVKGRSVPVSAAITKEIKKLESINLIARKLHELYKEVSRVGIDFDNLDKRHKDGAIKQAEWIFDNFDVKNPAMELVRGIFEEIEENKND